MANRANTTTGENWRRRALHRGLEFVVVRSPSPYNGIIGRSKVKKFQAVPSTAHGMLKLLVKGGVINLKSIRLVSLECAMVSGLEGNLSATKKIVEERVKVAINPEYLEQIVMISSTLLEEGRNKGTSPVRQKKRGQAVDRNQAIQEEVVKLVEAGIMKEVHHHDWLSNPVMVKKHDGNWTIVEEGIFLGYTVNTKGLKVCPDKVDVVLSLPSLKCLKDVQKLNGKLASLNTFLAKSAEKSLPFFKTLKKCTKKSDCHRTAKAKKAFKQMKQLIAELPMLTAPVKRDELIVYFTAAKDTISADLMTEREAKQMLIYFVSRALRGPKIKCTSMEKLVLALVHTSNPKEILSSTPNHSNYGLANTTGAIKIGSCREATEVEHQIRRICHTLQTQSVSQGADISRIHRLIFTNPEGMKFTYALRFSFDATNNEAEYEALIAGLRIAKKMGVKNLQANVDSRLASQVNGTYIVKEVVMIQYLEKMTPIFEYLTEETLPADVKESRAVRRPLQVNYVLRDIHERSCSMHPGTRSIVAKASRIGYYWPTMHKDARTLIKACQDSQVHKPVPRNPQQQLTPITSPWPFYKWGIDIAGPFPEGPKKVKFLIVAMDYFTYLGEGIKARLDAGNKNWMEELSHVLWAYRTMIKSSNEDTPFSLTYETETVIPTEIGMPTLRTEKVDLIQNNEALEINLDLLEERIEQAAIHDAKSKAKIEMYYNSKVRNTSFKLGDVVYRNNDASRAEDTGKLGPKWEGPYKVTEALGKGAYKLRDLDGKQLSQTWNISNLKKYYIHKM
nr:hypothetical protein [Tanacetum cinerariifolium]